MADKNVPSPFGQFPPLLQFLRRLAPLKDHYPLTCEKKWGRASFPLADEEQRIEINHESGFRGT